MGNISLNVAVDADVAAAALRGAGYTVTPPSQPPPPPPSGTEGKLLTVPAGWSKVLYHDDFDEPELDLTKWTGKLGGNGGWWNNRGQLPDPYTGSNMPTNLNLALFHPDHARIIDKKLHLVAEPYSGQFAAQGYSWISGCIQSQGKMNLPKDKWRLAVRAKMPDCSKGLWPAIWLMPIGGSGVGASLELDVYEGGWSNPNVNRIFHYDYFSVNGERQGIVDVGVDISADFHTIECEYIAGQRITTKFDGKTIRDETGVPISPVQYGIILELQVMGAGGNGWHTVTDGKTGGEMIIDEMAVYV